MQDSAIVLYPDPRLETPARPVERFDADLAALADRLVGLLDSLPAIGLAAPHIGVDLRVVAVKLPGEDAARVLVNPVLVWASDERAIHEEGSVSMPGISDRVERPRVVRVGFHHLDGRADEALFGDFSAAVLAHEIDQLDGLFWTGRLTRLRRERLLKRWRKRGRD